MYNEETVQILDLLLDVKNPRFILPDTGRSQENIRKYLLEQEDALSLTKDIVAYGGLMPGDRIVVTKENDKYVVLEGNRRTCACQMLIDRSLIPPNFLSKIPTSDEKLIRSISTVKVDIIPSREDAKRFLATRHIERTREWSPIAKMRFCYEDYSSNHSVTQISQRTGLTTSNINKYIRNYKILIRGIDSEWTSLERDKLYILDIKPDKLIRLFSLQETKDILQLDFDCNNVLQSKILSPKDIDEIIHIWTYEAFISNNINTRTSFGEYKPDGESTGACKYIAHILTKLADTDSRMKSTGSTTAATGIGSATSGSSATGSSIKVINNPKLSPFFLSIDFSHVIETQFNGKGVISVCKEIQKVSTSNSFIENFPICTAFLIRTLIEQSIKYYAKQHGYWDIIIKGKDNYDPKLSTILSKFIYYKETWLPDKKIQDVFLYIFSEQHQSEKFNTIIHSPELYILPPETLKSIPNEGLLGVINYLLQ